MDFRRLSDTYAVCGQITAADVPAIVKAGYRSVMCNRPDGEQPGQPAYAEIEAAALAQGLAFRHVPVVSGMVTADNVADFDKALAELPAPLFAYCRSGARCTSLWSMSRSGRS